MEVGSGNLMYGLDLMENKNALELGFDAVTKMCEHWVGEEYFMRYMNKLALYILSETREDFKEKFPNWNKKEYVDESFVFEE